MRFWQNRRSRRSVLGGALPTAATVLAACGGAGTESGGGTGATADQPVKLTYLHQWSQQQGHGPATEQMVARFRQQFPTIQVEPSFTTNYYEKLPTVLAAGDFPDVVTSNVGYLLSMVKKGIVVSPETLNRGPHRFNKNDMVAASAEMVTFDGKVMAMPYILSNLGLAYNQTLFKQHGLAPTKPPATWAELAEMGRRLSTGDGDAETWGFQVPRGTGGVPVDTWLCFLWQNGGAEVDLNRRVATWNTPAGVEALQFWVDLMHKYQTSKLQLPPDPHLAGRVGIWTTPTGSMSIVEKAVGNQFEWAAAVLPRNKQAASNVGGHTLVVLKTDRYHDQAWRFVHWFTSPQNVVEFNVPSTTLPPWKTAQQQPTWQRYEREQPRIKPFVEMLAYGHPPPKLATWNDVITVLGQGIESALTLKQPPRAALDEAARIAEPLLKQG